MAATTRCHLADLGVLETPPGQAAVRLAEELDVEERHTGSSVAALVGQFVDSLTSAERLARPALPDELAARRSRRFGW